GKNMTTPGQTLFYMFSGPDFLYASAFFPNASTYVLSGLEPTGRIPDVLKLRGSALSAALGHLKVSLRQMLSHSYFITSEMGTHLANDGVSKSGFLKFCEQLGTGDSFVKSASYLLHGGGFSQVREFLLKYSNYIVQDDTGIPVSFFKEDTWTLQPFGNYTRPIP